MLFITVLSTGVRPNLVEIVLLISYFKVNPAKRNYMFSSPALAAI